MSLLTYIIYWQLYGNSMHFWEVCVRVLTMIDYTTKQQDSKVANGYMNVKKRKELVRCGESK